MTTKSGNTPAAGDPNSEGDLKKDKPMIGRHYRRFYADELEHVKEIMPVESPFDQFMIKKGQTRGASKGLLSLFGSKKEDDSGATSTEQIMGKFKGIVTVESEGRKKHHEQERRQALTTLITKLNLLSLKLTN